MNLSFDQIVALIEKAAQLGVKEIYHEGLRIRFKSNPVKQELFVPAPNEPVTEAKSEELVKPMSVLDEMSAEEILYYATPHYDTLQAEKESRKNIEEQL